MNQQLLPSLPSLEPLLLSRGVRHLFVVHDAALPFLSAGIWLEGLPARTGIAVTRFSDFRPNPRYESVVEGVRAFREAGADAVFAVGGGSAMDVAKCVKLYCAMDESRSFPEQPVVPNDVPLIAMPTTAGTGSEATRFAVIYLGGEKQSVTDESIIPSIVILDPGVLQTLPLYQRKATLLDALTHAVESCWSVNSTGESRAFSTQAIRMILTGMSGYLANEDAGNAILLRAAHIAGQAINIAQTTAGHAMCYKLTRLYGLAHGHPAALCVRALFPWMIAHPERWNDPRGAAQTQGALCLIAEAMGCADPAEAAVRFTALVDGLGLETPHAAADELDLLTRSVNPVRLKNFPAALDEKTIRALYREILNA